MVAVNNKLTITKKAGESLAISIATRMRQYDAGHIARWSTSRASLEATGCCHRSSACAVFPQWPPWSTNLNETAQNKNTNKTQLLASNYGTFRSLVVCENFGTRNLTSTRLIGAFLKTQKHKSTNICVELTQICVLS